MASIRKRNDKWQARVYRIGHPLTASGTWPDANLCSQHFIVICAKIDAVTSNLRLSKGT